MALKERGFNATKDQLIVACTIVKTKTNQNRYENNILALRLLFCTSFLKVSGQI